MASIPISTDAWGLDVVATASQKGWMLPPGLAFLSFGERAWEAHAESRMPKFYLDMAQYKRYYEIGQPPYTPSVSVMFALDNALDQLLAEGLGSVYERHAAIGQFTRDGVRSLGLELFAKDERYASNTVTAVSIPGRGGRRGAGGQAADGAQRCDLRRAGVAGGSDIPHRSHGEDDRGGHRGDGGGAEGGAVEQLGSE